MEKIQHTTVRTNGINMHVATAGSGPDSILFVHGFPELWYTWRHQMVSLAALGYRTIAPDLRGYGDTDAPPSHESYTAFHIVGDLVGLLDSMGIEKVFLVGHDWGAAIAWYFCLFRPDRIKALVNMSVVFHPRNPNRKPVDGLRAILGDDYYICRFQAPGEIEEDFARADTANIMKFFLVSRNPRPPQIPKEGFSCLANSRQMDLPSWLSEEDINYYASKFSEKGFTGGLNYYRVMNLNWELTAPFTGLQIKVPAKFMVGDLDITYNTPGTKEFIHNGGLKKHVPFLQEVVVMEGVAHFINQEKPEEVTAHIYDFIKKF
ncbi:uncharacterized protein LOC116216024 [Punica granatum]|uniref:soluble epoxide hydrolase n=1 Tax=Punica granatum TaxID=22663 RepID=A0A6P8ECM6_PUNGR|nr:uncharacterized protein LOC116190366 [Punica granatum]XP_031407802.1 uncharacterized protein LOC116216024 [Punica granatum]